MSTDKLVDKIPDIYFDWYARLLPGAIFIIYYFHIKNEIPSTSASYLFLYGVIAYVAGHIAQPAASFAVDKLQRIMKTDEETYKEAKKSDKLSSLTGKASKAHAEAVSMFSTGCLLLVLSWRYDSWSWFKILVIGYFFIASVERTYARKIKINDLS